MKVWVLKYPKPLVHLTERGSKTEYHNNIMLFKSRHAAEEFVRMYNIIHYCIEESELHG